jgi:hypothetical protein
MSRPIPIEVQKYLSGVDYPVTKENLLAKARDNGAGADVLTALRKLPERDHNGPNAVSSEGSQE